MTVSVSVEWLAFLLYIEISGSVHSPKADYPDGGFS
jgi:hypothetical protein